MPATLRCDRKLAPIDGIPGEIPNLASGPGPVHDHIQLVVTDRDAAFQMCVVEELSLIHI